MDATLSVYVKPNSNCHGMSLVCFKRLSETVVVEAVNIPFPDGTYSVRGWSSLYGGSFVPVSLAKVEHQSRIGILVFGGDWGLKLEKSKQVYGRPIIWIENENDVPEFIRNQWQ